MLEAGAEIVARRRDGSETERTTLHPGHIAVLVRTNSHATMVRDALQAVGVPAVIGGSGSVFATAPAQEWLRLLEALERPTARDRASLVALTLLRRLDGRRGGVRFGGGVGGPALVPAPVGGPPARPGRRVPVRDGQQRTRRASAGARALVGRALHDRPPAHRPAPARGGRVRGTGPDRDGHLAGTAHPRCRARRRERGTGAATRVRRRGGPGHHHPPQQGSGVPDRLLPGDLGRPGQHVGGSRLPRPDRGQPADHRRGPRGQRLQQAPEARARGGTGRGPPPALRRSDPGLPPGHRVVGRRHGQPAFAPGPPALRPRPRWARPSLRGQRCAVDDEVEAAARALGPRVAVERVGPPPACTGTSTATRRRSWRRRASTARSIPSGDEPPTRASPRPPTTNPPSAASPNSASLPTKRSLRLRCSTRWRRRSWPKGRGRSHSAWPTCPAAPWWGRWCTASSSGATSKRPTSRSAVGEALERETTWRNVDLGGTEAAWRVVPGHCVAPRAPGRRHRACVTSPRRPARRADLRDPAGGRRHAGHDAARRRAGRPARVAPARQTTRWPATPTGFAIRRSTPCCAAI